MNTENIYQNVFAINTNKYKSIEDEYKCFLSEFNRLSKIKPQNLSSEENMLLEMLVLFISNHQEKIDPAQSWVKPNQEFYLLAA